MIRLLAALVFAVSMVPLVEAQCNVAGTTTYVGFLFKTLTGGPVCVEFTGNPGNCVEPLVASGSRNCATTLCLGLGASIGAPAPNYCQWTCTGCGTPATVIIRVDGSTGLPVELLELEIE